MPTVAEYIELIPDLNVRSLVKKRVDIFDPSDLSEEGVDDTIGDMLNCAFSWSKTEEGMEYWSRVHKKYQYYHTNLNSGS